MLKLDTVVRARIDQKTKERAEAVLAAIGLTLSDAVRLMMIESPKRGRCPSIRLSRMRRRSRR